MVLQGLGADFPLPILLAQHIAQGFVSLLCNWLNTATPIPARIAQQGERLQAGHVYPAPQGYHMARQYARRCRLTPGDAP